LNRSEQLKNLKTFRKGIDFDPRAVLGAGDLPARGELAQTPSKKMKRETRRAWRELAYFSSIGFSVAFSIFIGLFVGIALDRYFDVSPWCTLIFLALGIAAGFRNLGLAIRRSRRL